MRNDHTRRRCSRRNTLIKCTSELSNKRPHVYIYIYICVASWLWGKGGSKEEGEGRERRGQGGRKSLYFLQKTNHFDQKACIPLVKPIKTKVKPKKTLYRTKKTNKTNKTKTWWTPSPPPPPSWTKFWFYWFYLFFWFGIMFFLVLLWF